MKNKTNILIFSILQIMIIISNLLLNNTLEHIFKLLLTIYIFIYLFVIKNTKDKKTIIYLIISILMIIFYGFNIELNLKELISIYLDYIYCPLTLIYILNNRKILKNVMQRTKTILVLISTFLSLFIIIDSILKNEVILAIPIIVTLLYPLSLMQFNKEINLINTIFLVMPTIAILLSNFNILIMSLIAILLIYLVHNVIKKNNLTQSIILLITPILYLICFNCNVVSVKFYAQKSFVYMLLENIIYYLPFLYIYGQTIPRIKKVNEKNFDLYLIVISMTITFMIGIYTSTIFFNNFYIIIYSIIIALYLNKLELLEKKLDNNKITIFALHLGYGGIEQYLSSLCMMLENDYDVEIISTYKLLDNPAFKFSKDIKIKYLINEGPNKEEIKSAIKEKNYLNILKEGIKSLKILYQKRYLNIEAIYNTTSKYIITTRDFHNELIGNYSRESIIKIATEHNYHNNDKKYIKKVIKSVKKTDYFILVSEELKEFYQDKVNAECIYIPNVIDSIPTKYSKCNKHNIISIGRLSKEKGQKDLIDVVEILKKEYKDIKLYLVGDGEEKNNIKKYINKKKLDKNVVLTGFLSKNDIELKLLDSSIFVTTSYTESFGLVVLEACSYKLPVVAFDSATGVKKLLENGSGILIPNRNKEKMKEEISKLFENNDYKTKVSNQGYNNCKKYLAKNVKKQWLEVIKK